MGVFYWKVVGSLLQTLESFGQPHKVADCLPVNSSKYAKKIDHFLTQISSKIQAEGPVLSLFINQSGQWTHL